MLDLNPILIACFRIQIRFQLEIGWMISIPKNKYTESFEIGSDYSFSSEF